MSTYYANDKYNAVLTAGYSVGQTTLYVSAVPNHVPTIIVAAKGTDNETVFAVTDKTSNSLTGVSRLRGANVDLDAQTPLTCLNNEEFINQLASVNAVFNEEHDETGKHTTDQINEKTEDAGVTVDGVKHKDSQVYTDQINEKTEDAGVTLDGLKMKDGRVVAWDGWMPAEEGWTYASTNDPVGQIYATGDVTGKYSAGMRLKMTNASHTIYGLITEVGSYDAGNNRTPITFLHEIDPTDNLALYLLENSAITNPYYSTHKAPTGFPIDVTKWNIIKNINLGSTQYEVAGGSKLIIEASKISAYLPKGMMVATHVDGRAWSDTNYRNWFGVGYTQAPSTPKNLLGSLTLNAAVASSPVDVYDAQFFGESKVLTTGAGTHTFAIVMQKEGDTSKKLYGRYLTIYLQTENPWL